MEHRIYNRIRKYKIPLFIRIIIMIFFVFIGLILIILPIPGSAILGWSSIILGLIFILQAKNIKSIVKIRKGLFYFIKNFKDKRIRQHKIYDIKKHVQQILNNKK